MKVLLRDKDFVEKMEEKVKPFLTNRINSGFFERIEGQPIYYEHYEADDKKGTVVIVHGFTEFIRKLDEVMYYFLKGGYSVWAIEQRGHGSSYKTATDPDVVQIDDYNDLIEDLHYMVVNLVMKDCNDGLPRILYGHSMGGAVSACFAERYPDIFDRIILSSPMLRLKTGKMPYRAMYAFLKGLIAAGKGREPLPGSAPLGEEYVYEDGCGTCRQRDEFAYNLKRSDDRYRACMPSCDTVMQFHLISEYARSKKNAQKIKAKVLLLQADDDTLVHPDGGKYFMKNVAFGRLIRVKNSKHEIYDSTEDVLRKYWKLIMDFCRGDIL